MAYSFRRASEVVVAGHGLRLIVLAAAFGCGWPLRAGQPLPALPGPALRAQPVEPATSAAQPAAEAPIPAAQREFFEARIRPLLAEHCFKCHSGQVKSPKGGLRLDWKQGWQTGGDSGEPAILPGKPNESPLIGAVRHEPGHSAMPPGGEKLSPAQIADLVTWIEVGAPDPRTTEPTAAGAEQDWQALYRQRLDWWSLKPVASIDPPAVRQTAWPRNEVDAFVLRALEERDLQPVEPADPAALVRRLSFALVGLPPDPETVVGFVAAPTEENYQALVSSLLGSPAFGERWARHWMDVVHYADTHGYEWDVPAKNAWRYRDYLVRAFNADLPIDRFLLEQLAGDLLEPRIDPATGVNECLLATMCLRLGERRHGDNSDHEGITQEAVANMIDTLGKGFLATTLACAQCHDHKLDAVSQRDYYALAGVLMSTRWAPRAAEAVDRNAAVIERLRGIKGRIRETMALAWQGAAQSLPERIKALPVAPQANEAFPETLAGFWRRAQNAPITAEQFRAEQARRQAHNAANLTLLADFARDETGGWRWEGSGMRHGLAADGEIVLADEGDAVVAQVVPAGRYTHLWSRRLAGALRSARFDSTAPVTFSIALTAGQHAAVSSVVDQAFHCERMRFLDQPALGWLPLTAGGFRTLEGGIDMVPRRLYFDLVTKGLNNYFPPRTNYGGLKESDLAEERSWFGVTQIYMHAPGSGPQDDLARFAPLFEAEAEWSSRLAGLIARAIERFARRACERHDALLLDEALRLGLLPNTAAAHPDLPGLLAEYKAQESRLVPDQTVGAAAEWREAADERLAVRGVYTDLADSVPRGGPAFLGGPLARALPDSAGRLELARQIVSHQNPLTARVFVNRVWHHLFGEGLARTPDDFGHLGQPPTHPELLDFLAARFMREGWSLKRLVGFLVSSATFRQGSTPRPGALALDAENRLWHHYPMRRLDAEAIRDSLLVASARFDGRLFGPPVDPFRTAQDPAKRLFSGPLDGLGRRSIYTKITLMEPPRFLALFNQPLPKLTTGRRDVTLAPDQALALLNDPFVHELARHWGAAIVADGAATAEERAARMFLRAVSRPATAEETARMVAFLRQAAELRLGRGAADREAAEAGAALPAGLLQQAQPWQDLAHALFNLKEFIYVP